MNTSWMTTWRRLRHVFAGAAVALALAACGSGSSSGTTPPPVTPPPTDPALADGNSTTLRLVLSAVPPAVVASTPSGGGSGTTTLRVHWHRASGDYTGAMIHTWGAANSPTWNQGFVPDGTDGFGVYFNVQLNATSGAVGYILHIGDSKDDNGVDQSYTLQSGTNEIWRIEGDLTTYTAIPGSPSVSTLDARAFWLTGKVLQWPGITSAGTAKLYWSATGKIVSTYGSPISGSDGSITLDAFTGSVPADVATRFQWIAAGNQYTVRDADVAKLNALHTSQVVLVQEDTSGNVQNSTTAQIAGAMDDLYSAASTATLGPVVAAGSTTYKLWAPTAQSVELYRYDTATGDATHADAMAFDATTGIWSTTIASDTSGTYYRFGVKVFVRGVGVVRNLVTDPYSFTLAADSKRSEVVSLAAANTKPSGWDSSAPPATVSTSTDQTIYELHVRDFSDNDATVPAAHRGKYLAFTDTQSNGMKHLAALASAGLTDVHLMPMFDFSTVPEASCVTPSPTGAADSDAQQALVTATKDTDCYNWGYDPYHFNAPEGSYATSVDDGLTRVVEFRSMVQALNAAGLRVGMDVVFNHTTSSGQNDHSVLDEVVPGYYYRYSAQGDQLGDSCCADTAGENHMMGKLISDSVIMWARDYHVSSFRYDIMGMLPKDVLVALQAKVDGVVGRHVEMLGEGWNFGAVANGARFPQAAMGTLAGSGIGAFNPYLRDAVRGGSPGDSGNSLVSNQGFINGLYYDPNDQGTGHTLGDLLWAADEVKAGLAGSLKDYVLNTSWDATLPLSQMNGGYPLGFVDNPSEAVNYVENHDSQTLFDTSAYKLPVTTSQDDRARVQMLGAALVSFGQGVAYYHAGVDTLRSKSLDGNSYDSGDWFNRLDWSYADNNFGVGLPIDSSSNWDIQRPLLGNALIKPTATQIAWTRDQFRDLLRIRKSTSLLHMSSAADIKARLKFWNTGSAQVPTVIVGDLDGSGGYAGANFAEVTYFVNVDKQAHQMVIPALAGKGFVLHPVHLAAGAADTRAATATYDAGTGTFSIPARTAVVFVVPQ